MQCPNCGSNLPDEARFCTECGSPLNEPPQSDSDWPRNASGRFVPGADRHGQTHPRGTSNRILVAVAALMVFTLVITSIMTCARIIQGGSASSTKQQPVVFIVEIDGYHEGSSRIPLHITGTDSAGNEVDRLVFLAYEGIDCTLAPGSYQARFLASPIASDGTLYGYPTRTIEFEVSNRTPSKGFQMANEHNPVHFTPLDPASVTDEQIADAARWARTDEKGNVDVSALEQAARKRRDDAVATQGAPTAEQQQEMAPADEPGQAEPVENPDAQPVTDEVAPEQPVTVDEAPVTEGLPTVEEVPQEGV